MSFKKQSFKPLLIFYLFFNIFFFQTVSLPKYEVAAVASGFPVTFSVSHDSEH